VLQFDEHSARNGSGSLRKFGKNPRKSRKMETTFKDLAGKQNRISVVTQIRQLAQCLPEYFLIFWLALINSIKSVVSPTRS
jgi:hypothetical protein